MFAYCGNNPVNASDPTGHSMKHALQSSEGVLISLVSTAALAAYAGPSLVEKASTYINQIFNSVNKWFENAKRDVYEYAQSLIEKTVSKFENHQPRVHHIVPQGAFSNRLTAGTVKEMQDILWEVGIDPANDALNLVVVSQGYHASLHTDEYIISLYHVLEPVRGDRDGVIEVLHTARLLIAFADPYAKGY